MSLLTASHLVKEVRDGEHVIRILNDVSVSLEAGERVALVGPSGSGKSTLLHILGALDRTHQGDVVLDGVALRGLSDKARARLRGREIGFVFQAYNLVSRATVLENVLLPSRFGGAPIDDETARDVLADVGLGEKTHRLPHQLSGGERQRVAIARALVQRPKLVLCDEPTGNLDAETGGRVLALFDRLTASGAAVLIATHDEAIASSSKRRLVMRDGRFV